MKLTKEEYKLKKDKIKEEYNQIQLENKQAKKKLKLKEKQDKSDYLKKMYDLNNLASDRTIYQESTLNELNSIKTDSSCPDQTIMFSNFANPNRRKELNLPRYTKSEELFNAISHIIGAFLGLIGLIIGSYYGYLYKGIEGLICMLVFGITMVFLYTMSGIYHFLFVNKAKKVFQIMDHCTIYVLIMGTYTPICVLNLENIYPYNLVLLGVVYLLGIIGIVFNAIMMEKLPVKILSNSLYLIIGWLIICFYPFLAKQISTNGLILIIMGGVSYTLGAILYAIGSKKKYFHSIFHIFVLIGTILQYLGILLYGIMGM